MTRSFNLRPAWTPLNILLMVLGFVFFWPLGLAMLAYILWGERLEVAFNRDRFANHNRSWWNEAWSCGDGYRSHRNRYSRSGGGSPGGPSRWDATGNAAFDEYREREMKRLEEERRKLDEMRAEFDEFLGNLRKARDQEEFERFVNNRSRGDNGPAAPENRGDYL